MPSCGAAGEYRAPKSRQSLRDYWWFCLEHVRAYNSAWDFYKGMTPGEIEAQLRGDSVGHRPTWPLGRLGTSRLDEAALRDPLGVLAALRAKDGKPATPQAPTELREPLNVLGLEWPLTMDVLKTRYKTLAKRHHPDANNGDRDAEERLKVINLAYATLRSRLAADPPLAAAG
jgi:hypothetical protein